MTTRFVAEPQGDGLWRVIDTQEAELYTHNVPERIAKRIAEALNASSQVQ